MRTSAIMMLLAMVLVACGEQESQPEVTETTPATPLPPDTAVTDTIPAPAAPDTVVSASVGEDFSFVLEANPTTGYSWVLAGIQQSHEVVRQSGDPVYTPGENPEGMVGAGGCENWTFSAISIGEALIELEYMPPGRDSEPGTVWTAKVVVE